VAPDAHDPFRPRWPLRGTSRPYLRWWWLAGPFRQQDIVYQLDWVKDQGFGGVELAWLWPSWLSVPQELLGQPVWLNREWSQIVAFAKTYADQVGLGCDFTFGSCWPFGGSCVAFEDAARTFFGMSSQRLGGSWEEDSDQPLYIVDHLRRAALENYAAAMIPAFAEALAGSPSALFCDSLELDTENMWSLSLWDSFANEFGYRLEHFASELDKHLDVRYDYRKFIGKTMRREFFEAFTDMCHRAGALSRVQCHGALTDLLAAYAAVDVPESEAILFNPPFSRIPASAAALAGKAVVSCESFTCLYGFITRGNLEPLHYWRKENLADLKLLADALIANGVNQIIWHGMPFNAPGGSHEFYASVHVGPDACFAGELPRFNRYLEKVSGLMRVGQPCAVLAVYLPNEDNWMAGLIPATERTPAATYRWEMRHVTVPPETEPYAPLWVSSPFLREAVYQDGMLKIGAACFQGLYVACDWLDAEALIEILRLARTGLPIIWRRQPSRPGRATAGRLRSMFQHLSQGGRMPQFTSSTQLRTADYQRMMHELTSLPNVCPSLKHATLRPLVTGAEPPAYWARQTEQHVQIFFAHPATRRVSYPLRYGQAADAKAETRQVCLQVGGAYQEITLSFPPYQSLLLRFFRTSGEVEWLNIDCPVTDPAWG
jgi:hypothetical protein